MMLRPYLGKYRALTAAVVSFLVIFLGVVGVNLQMSRQSAEAVSVLNLANLERTLAQRMARTLLEVREQARQGAVAPDLRTELRETVEGFGRTLEMLTRGGPARRLDGSAIELPAPESEVVIRLMRRAHGLWKPMAADLMPLLGSETISAEEADAAALVGVGELPALYNTMNDLAVALESDARARETTLQRVLWTGLLLAIANFLFIVLYSIGRLRRADGLAERTRKENADILRTVQEGLFLLDRERRIGGQQSRFLATIFGREDLAGTDFLELLQGKVTERTLSLASDYIGLLFGEHVNEKLVQSLNPLQNVEIGIADGRGQLVSKHLDVRFTRVRESGRTTHLLVTVVDVTARVRVEQELEALKLQSKDQFAILAKLMRGDPARMMEIAGLVHGGVDAINAVLREPADDPVALREKLDAIFAQVHRLKGDAACHGVDALEASLQQFEEMLAGLRARTEITGDDFMPAAVALDGLLAQADQIRAIGQTLAGDRRPGGAGNTKEAGRTATDAAAITGGAIAAPADPAVQALAKKLQAIASRVATRQGKAVELRAHGLELLPAADRAAAGDIAVQLIRNAIVHGIESPDARRAAGKPGTGAIVVDVVPNVAYGVTLSVHDDGGGIDIARVRARLAASGRFSAQRLAALSDREVATRIFDAGFSTRAEEADEDGGRGVGLDVVQRLAASLGGRVQVQSRPGRGTSFRLVLSTPVMVTPYEPMAVDGSAPRAAADGITALPAPTAGRTAMSRGVAA
jgi:two-component system chemotaxis sensor kinase CheA